MTAGGVVRYLLSKRGELHRSPLDFDVGFDVDVPPHQVTTHHTNHGFGGRGTVPDDMRHDETVLWALDYETAALYYYYNNIYI